MRKSSILLSALALAGAAVSASLWLELRAERERNTELLARLDVARAEPAAHESAAKSQNRGQAVTSPTEVNLESADTSAYVSQPTQEEEDLEVAQRRHLRDPKYREAWREERRLAQSWLREDLIKLVGFTPEQADKVVDLSVDGQLRALERTVPDPVTAEYEQKRRAEDETAEITYQAKLRELLGADGVGRLQAYFESRGTRHQVGQLRNELTGANALRDDQVEPLIAALQVERSRMERELATYREAADPEDVSDASARKYAELYAEQLKSAHDRMHISAAAILSHAQLETLDTMLRRERERSDAERRMSRIQSRLDVPGEAAPRVN
jgi:hypothetical protein